MAKRKLKLRAALKRQNAKDAKPPGPPSLRFLLKIYPPADQDAPPGCAWLLVDLDRVNARALGEVWLSVKRAFRSLRRDKSELCGVELFTGIGTVCSHSKVGDLPGDEHVVTLAADFAIEWLDGDDTGPEAFRATCNTVHLTTGGLYWEFLEKNTDCRYTTAELPWESIAPLLK